MKSCPDISHFVFSRCCVVLSFYKTIKLYIEVQHAVIYDICIK